MGSFSIWHWLIVLVIVLLVFGTKKIKSIGGDVGGWIRDFRKAVKDGNDEPPVVDINAAKRVIDGEVVVNADNKKV